MEKDKIDRINELAKKQKSASGLTEQEKEEQRVLRMEFLEDFRARFKQQLDNLDVEYIEDQETSKKPN